MTPQPFDHLLLVVLAVLLPAYGVRSYKRLKRDIAAGRPGARVRIYREDLFLEWIPTIALLVFWALVGRAWSALGLEPLAGWGGWVGAGLTVVLIAVLLAQLRGVRDNPAVRAKLRTQMADVADYIPHDDVEARWFTGLAITAGICEEVLYRGFLIAYFAAYMPVAGAWALSTAAFGIAHSYQGIAGVLRTAVAGGVMGGLYLLSGSLWAPIVAHAVYDLIAGSAGRLALTEPGDVEAEAPAATYPPRKPIRGPHRVSYGVSRTSKRISSNQARALVPVSSVSTINAIAVGASGSSPKKAR